MTEQSSPAPDLASLLDAAPFHHLLKMELLAADREAGVVRIRLGFRPEYGRSAGERQFHGGAIASLADSAATFAVIAKSGKPAATIDLFTSFLRPATGAWIEALASTRRVGRSIGVADVEITGEGGALVAIARACLSTA